MLLVKSVQFSTNVFFLSEILRKRGLVFHRTSRSIVDSNKLLLPPPMTRWMMLLVKLVKFSRCNSSTLDRLNCCLLCGYSRRIFLAEGKLKLGRFNTMEGEKKGREGKETVEEKKGKGGSMEGQRFNAVAASSSFV